MIKYNIFGDKMQLKEISLLLKILEEFIELLGEQNYNLLLENENGYFKVMIKTNEKISFCYQMNLSKEIGETFINWLRLKFIQENEIELSYFEPIDHEEMIEYLYNKNYSILDPDSAFNHVIRGIKNELIVKRINGLNKNDYNHHDLALQKASNRQENVKVLKNVF